MNNEIKFDNYNLEKHLLKTCNFKTKNSHDISFQLLETAFNNINRIKSVEKLFEYVKQFHIAQIIERGIFEFALITVSMNKFQNHLVINIYADKLCDICKNLNINDMKIKNKTLIKTIFNKNFDPYYVAFLSPEQMHPEKWAPIILKHEKETEIINSFQTTDLYKCKKCGEKKFKITEIQLRSADEPSNRIYTCMVCYNVFIK